MIGFCLLFVFVFFLASCASRTGRGEFPAFSVENPSSKSLTILPPIGLGAEDLSSSILTHADVSRLSNHFESSYVAPNDTAAQLLNDNFSGERITSEETELLQDAVDADLLLGFYIHELGIKEYSATETRTLFRTSSSHRNTSVRENESIDVDSEDDETGISRSSGSYVTSHSSNVSSREIPIRAGKIRITLSMSALVYDVNQEKIIWRGRRIERSENDTEDLSTIELKDIVVERIMYRIVSRLTY
jgi:hypothetical protein